MSNGFTGVPVHIVVLNLKWNNGSEFRPVNLRRISLDFGTLFHHLFCNFSTENTHNCTESVNASPMLL